MGVIGINEVVFPVIVTKMRFAGNAINGNITTWASQGENATAFARFSNDFDILQSIINEYKKLVLKDISAINKVGAEIIKTDKRLLNIWR